MKRADGTEARPDDLLCEMAGDYDAGRAAERADIVAWLRGLLEGATFPRTKQEYADEIERGAHRSETERALEAWDAEHRADRPKTGGEG